MASSARVLIVGRSGQVASALRGVAWPEAVAVEARGRDSADLRRPESIAAAVAGGGWAAVVNAGGYANVDGAEDEAEAAFALNRDGPAALADACALAGVPLVHISTDYVFDGKRAAPYTEDDAVNPLSVYATSKAEGEAAVRARLREHVIVRIAWVFGPTGNNFLRTMLRLGAEREELRIVDDQRGQPTADRDVAQMLMRVVTAIVGGKTDGFGTFHFASAGAASRYELACEIFRQAKLRGVAPIPRLTAVPASAYPTPARRPMYSVLDCGRMARTYGVSAGRWEAALAETLDVLLGPVPARNQMGAIR